MRRGEYVAVYGYMAISRAARSLLVVPSLQYVSGLLLGRVVAVMCASRAGGKRSPGFP